MESITETFERLKEKNKKINFAEYEQINLEENLSLTKISFERKFSVDNGWTF